MHLELANHLEQHQTIIREQAETEVFNSVAEMLSISFEKYDMEVIIEPDKYLINKGNTQEIPEPIKTEINFEDIVETQDKLELTLSGAIKDKSNYEETFLLFFSLHCDQKIIGMWKSGHGKNKGMNSLCLQFYRKAEQLSDPLFRASWVYENSCGNKYSIGEGKGILTFARGQQMKAN